ncbi:MAG: haloacid dehalogenase type II [Rubrimonas sp.]|uniref:haloacid dehalogenase type II n=1 Tax=Rubrimonas sp. TaxID=2036015 RepID=UPI002FDE86A8
MLRSRLCVFDAYGTLFDVAGAAREAAQEPGRAALKEHWPRLSELWRRKQLEYTWIRAVTGVHVDFWDVTCDALDYAMETLGLDDRDLRLRLRELYLKLPPYPEVESMLRRLKEAEHKTAILSNGSPDMLGGALRASGLTGLFDKVISVEEAGVFKPARAVYDLVGAHFGVESPGEVLFVSSNYWDAASATAYGFHTMWVNRDGAPADRIPREPRHVAKSLAAVPAIAATL